MLGGPVDLVSRAGADEAPEHMRREWRLGEKPDGLAEDRGELDRHALRVGRIETDAADLVRPARDVIVDADDLPKVDLRVFLLFATAFTRVA